MKTKKIISLKILIAIACLLTGTVGFAQKSKNKSLDTKKFKVLFYEMKATGRGKSQEGVIEFTMGKIKCPFTDEKLKTEPCNFNIVLDSTYTEDDTQMHMIKFEAFLEAKSEETIWEGTVINDDIDGTVLQKKGGLDKKKFEYSGGRK